MDIDSLKFLYNLVGQLTFSPINEESKQNFLLAYDARKELLRLIEEYHAHSKSSSS
jgi:hypothetical protein